MARSRTQVSPGKLLLSLFSNLSPGHTVSVQASKRQGLVEGLLETKEEYGKMGAGSMREVYIPRYISVGSHVLG